MCFFVIFSWYSEIFLNLMMRQQNARLASVRILTLSFLTSLSNLFTDLFVASFYDSDDLINSRWNFKTTLFTIICWSWTCFFSSLWHRAASVNLSSKNNFFFISSTLNLVKLSFILILIDFCSKNLLLKHTNTLNANISLYCRNNELSLSKKSD